MNRYPFCILLISIMAAACQSVTIKDKNNTDAGSRPASEKKNYFPVADYIRSEIGYVDSTPLALMKYNMQENKTDSGYIKLPEFDQLARQFLPEGIDSNEFEKKFSESSFLDQTTASLYFTYAKKDNEPGLQRVDVVAARDQGLDRVKSIYMEQTARVKDSFITQKMFWKSKRSFRVIRIAQAAGRPAVTTQCKVVWDNRQ